MIELMPDDHVFLGITQEDYDYLKANFKPGDMVQKPYCFAGLWTGEYLAIPVTKEPHDLSGMRSI